MITAILGEVQRGKLQRLAFLGYIVLLTVLLVVFGLVMALFIGAGEHLLGGDLQQAQETMHQKGTTPVTLVFSVVLALFIYAKLNITAKRIRDMGLPGWRMVLAIFIVDILLGIIVSREAVSSFMLVIFLLLLFIPTAMMAKKKGVGL
ncbi:hypothetical protein MD588_13175 [Photobacterium sp. SDRW27]|uniref:DUF805 domain-containing protein n=1 Tax=Photobacterium obscurum TaxID=2829490 RepID=UPI0022430F54|nr:DUF805 domain-containing protein [Photobacterium obscurum]MCW8329763.1 hypothetical protein [Photobacterium obscurum]